jgi:hypothetical protein
MAIWWPEIEQVLEIFARALPLLNSQNALPEKLEQDSLLFGWEFASDDLILHLVNGNRIIATREFILDLLQFLCRHLRPDLREQVGGLTSDA